jgi:hypothetical protein
MKKWEGGERGTIEGNIEIDIIDCLGENAPERELLLLLNHNACWGWAKKHLTHFLKCNFQIRNYERVLIVKVSTLSICVVL